MIFMATRFIGYTSYFLYEEVMVVSLYGLHKLKFCFYLSPNFWLLQSKIDTVKKIKNIAKKDGGQFRASSVKEKEILCEIQRFVM